jgi:iron complex outermembrane recepter protein
MKFRPKKLSLALARTFGAGMAVTMVSVAYAQTVVPLEPTQVTGSRIVSPNITSTSPVSQVTAADIRIEGVNTVESLLNNLPQVFAEFGGNVTNGATGTASVDLRDLGSSRTLVLVNGRRLPAGSPTFYSTDLNQIPAPLIERVEILTGGASAIYGSDAVAGVVNFIMKENFQGLQLQVDDSFFEHDQHNGLASVIAGRAATNPAQFAVPGSFTGGNVYDASITMGGNFADNRGNATLFFHYMKQDAVLEKSYDYSACSTGSSSAGLNCAGSGTASPPRFINLGGGTLADGSSVTFSPNGALHPFTANDQFNFAPYNYFLRPDERYGFNSFAHLDVNDHARVYGEFSFNDDHTDALIAPSGIFQTEQTLTNDNPFLSQAFKNAFGITPTTNGDLLIGKRNIEGGGRNDDRRHTSFRGVLGAKGDVAQYWDWDVFVQTGKVIYQETYQNDFSKARTIKALDVVTDPVSGQPVCRSKLDGTDPNCVPYNIFSPGGVTQAALAYLQTPGLQKGSTQQSVQGATLTSDLGNYGWRTPWAKSGVGVAFGVEHRTEKLDLETDTEFSTFDLAGQGGPTIGLGGQFSVKEAFVEVRVPIAENQPYADLLSVNGSYRYSDYSTNKTTNSYGLGAEWAPIKAFRLRGSYQQAVRAANIIELFVAQGLNLFSNSPDPCAGPTPSATAAQCARSGVSAAQYGSALLTNPAGQYNYLQGGNPNLDPETAKSTTVGAVFTPMKNLTGSVDYFRIKVNNTISAISPALVLNQCVFSGQFCNLIHRDAQGTLWLTGFITATNQNLGSLETSGIDATLDYVYPLNNYGSVDFNFVGTWLQEFKKDVGTGLGAYDCKGLFGATCGTPAPEWRHKARATWMTPWNTDLSVTWRHFDKVKIDSSSSDPQLAGSFDAVNGEMSSRDYLDLAASWNATKQITVWGGVNNVFDKDPPIISSSIAGPPFGNGNTYPQVYDSLGRKFFVSLQYKF